MNIPTPDKRAGASAIAARNRMLRLALGAGALAAALAVYVFTRASPPALLAPLQAGEAFLAAPAGWAGSAPSLFYTLAVGLALGAIAGSPAAARLHVAAWTLVALLLESTQAAILARPLGDALEAALPEPARDFVAAYWIRGTFDPWDLLATLGGGVLALAITQMLPGERADESTY